jgi:hypothetical protein
VVGYQFLEPGEQLAECQRSGVRSGVLQVISLDQHFALAHRPRYSNHRWPGSSLWVIGLFVGIDLLFHGWSWVILALSVRTVSKAAIA